MQSLLDRLNKKLDRLSLRLEEETNLKEYKLIYKDKNQEGVLSFYRAKDIHEILKGMEVPDIPYPHKGLTHEEVSKKYKYQIFLRNRVKDYLEHTAEDDIFNEIYNRKEEINE